jgi:hypothetical protein
MQVFVRVCACGCVRVRVRVRVCLFVRKTEKVREMLTCVTHYPRYILTTRVNGLFTTDVNRAILRMTETRTYHL